jgi:hypothetical protein
MGIEVSAEEVALEVARLRRRNFHTHADYRRYLKRIHFSPHDVNERVKVQILSTAIQEQLLSKVESPGQEKNAINKFTAAFHKRWRARTICATDHVVVDYCSNR